MPGRGKNPEMGKDLAGLHDEDEYSNLRGGDAEFSGGVHCAQISINKMIMLLQMSTFVTAILTLSKQILPI